MTLPMPNLDDWSFDDLVTEGVSMLPIHAPRWTNHNPSDPGITLLELLAYVSEILLFRLNQVSRESKLEFLRLLHGSADEQGVQKLLAGDEDGDDAVKAIDDAIRAAVDALAEPQRAVTKEDCEFLARRAATSTLGANTRTHCMVGRTLHRTASGIQVREYPGDFTVVVVPPRDVDSSYGAVSLRKVREKLLPHCLLGSRAHVVDAIYVAIAVGASLRTRVSRTPDQWLRALRHRLEQYFSPYVGTDPTISGWPFGRHVYISDVIEALQGLDGVDSVVDARFIQVSMIENGVVGDEGMIGVQIGIHSRLSEGLRIGVASSLGRHRLISTDRGQLLGISIQPYELVKVLLKPEDLRIVEEALPA